MGSNSKIEWTEATWNPVTGCTRASAGCDNCYAVKQTYRMERMGQVAKYGGLTVLNGKGDRHFNGVVRCHEDALTVPLKRRKPTVYFVNSMSDLFHPAVPFEFIDQVFAVMALTTQHTYQVLTKRPERMAAYLSGEPMIGTRGARRLRWFNAADRMTDRDLKFDDVPEVLPNVWLGTSVENQQAANARIPHLLNCPAAVRFLSCEPLLGPVDLTGAIMMPQWGEPNAQNLCPLEEVPTGRIDWVIAGGESGPGARPMHPDWARSLRDQCQAAGVAFFFKQWGEWCPFEPSQVAPYELRGQNGDEFDRHVLPSTISDHKPGHWWWPAIDDCLYKRVGKQAAGRLLDGRTWDELPARKVVA